MRIVAIVNPISGANKQRAGFRVLLSRLRQAGATVDEQATRGAGDARRLSREAADRSDVVIAVGGDGTICEIADGLAGGRAAMVVWPAGTENLVAKSLGFAARPETALSAVLDGPVRCLDLGTVNGRAFMVVAGVGFDAEVVERLTRLRTGHITHLSYAGPIWRTFWGHRWPELHIAADTPAGPLEWTGRGMAFVGNMARYSLGLPVVRDAVPDDGLLDLCVMACRNHLQLVGHSLRTALARHVEHRDVIYTRITRVRIESAQRVPVEIDGDFGGWLPLKIAIRPAAIRIKVPPSPDRR